MSWLSKSVSSVAPILNPVSYLGTTGVMKALGGGSLDDLMGIGAKPGPANPYGKPDLAYLADTSNLDYLKTPTTALGTSGFDFLKNPSAVAPSTSKLSALPDALKTFASTYKAPTGSSGLDFNDLINNINAPSSVDQVQSQLDNDRLTQLLSGIDSDTKNTIGSLKSDFADRGLGGPGMLSDIEGNSLAQAYGDANVTKANARNTEAQGELDRLKAKETAAQGAYTTRYQNQVASDNTDKTIAAAGATNDVNSYNQSLQDSLKQQLAEEDAAAGRTNTNQLDFASLLNSNNQQAATNTNSNNALFAQLLNARDLGAAGINSTNYNTAVGQQYQYAQPGFLQDLLKGFSSGGGQALGAALLG